MREHLDIIKEIELLSNKDIFLSGTNITSYNDGEVTLSGLCKDIFENCKDIKSLRLPGLDLQQFEEVKELINVVKDNNKICPIFHFPIHTCNSELLKRNNLDYSVKEIEEIMELCKNNQILYSWDIICGLPGETEEMFNDTLEIIKNDYESLTLVSGMNMKKALMIISFLTICVTGLLLFTHGILLTRRTEKNISATFCFVIVVRAIMALLMATHCRCSISRHSTQPLIVRNWKRSYGNIF